jgi:hypothetical protein
MKKEFNYVYLTTNLINGMQYVGDRSCNCDPENDKYIGSGRPYFKNAVKKYRKENFRKKILAEFETKQEAFNAQEKYINQFNTLKPNGYNISPKGGNNCSAGISQEGIEKIRNSKIGKKFTEKHLKNLRESHKNQLPWNKGKHHSKESLEKMRISHLGKKASKKTLEKMKLSHLGKTLSLEAREKLSKSKTGSHASEEARKNLSLSHKGKKPWNKGKTGLKHSEKTKEKIKKTMKEKGLCPQLYK